MPVILELKMCLYIFIGLKQAESMLSYGAFYIVLWYHVYVGRPLQQGRYQRKKEPHG